MKKEIFVILVLCSSFLYSYEPPADRASGLFMSFGVGPRMPIGYFSNSTEVGYGLNVELSYTDNEFLPIFLFARAGFEQFPGSQDFYQASDYSNFSTKSIPVQAGVRYYFAPLVENVVLFMPMVEASFNFNYYEKLHQFRETAQRSNFLEENSKLGVSAGVGFSMFLLEILASYNYYENNEYLNLDIKVRLPLYITY